MANPPVAKPPDSIAFHYIKSNFFRTCFVEGIYGGLSPRRMITMSFFNERNAIPKETKVALQHVGGDQFKAVGQEEVVDGKKGIVREVEVEIIMSPETAEAVHKWLGEKIVQIKAK